MPFKSEAQRRFMWAKHPEIAHRWAHEYPSSNKGLPYHKKDKSKKDKAEKKGNALLDGPLSDLFKTARASRPDRYSQFNQMLSNAYRHPDTHFGSIMTPVRALYESMGKDPHPALKVDSGDPQSPRSNYSVKSAFKAGFLLRCAEEGLDLDQMEQRLEKLEKTASDAATIGSVLGYPLGALGNVASGLGRIGLDVGTTALIGGPILAGGLMGYGASKLRPKPNPEDIKHDELRNEYLRLADQARRKTLIRNMQQSDPGSIVQLA